MGEHEPEEYTAYAKGWISFRFREKVTDAYILRLEGDTFCLAMQTESGKTILAYG